MATKNNTKRNKFHSIYGARLSKTGNHVNITLVSGEKDKREWVNCSVKIDSNARISAKVKDGFAYIKIPILQDRQDTEDLVF